MHQTLELGSNVAMGTIGKSIERIEDLALLRGAGRFGDDLPEAPGCKHAAFLRSPLAHAKIAAIDISQAKKILKWEPNIELELGLKNTVSYFKKILNRM